jgi:argininosuccinate synthase
LKQNLAREFSVQVYNGMWNSPEAQFTRKTIDSSQTFVNGTVKIQLYKGFARVIARSSPTSVYDATLASMDELTGNNIFLSKIKFIFFRLQSG